MGENRTGETTGHGTKAGPDAVDSKMVPQRVLHTGARMPGIGLGTFGSDLYPGEQVAEAVLGAAQVGYRHFDCAAVYGNENQIGHALNRIVKGGVPRDDLWLTSKLWNNRHGEEDVIPTCEQSLRDLQLTYLDLYLIHWPFPNHHEPGVDVTSRSQDARPYIHENYMKTWRRMEKLVDMGLVRHIGTSNMTIPKLNLLRRDAEIQPAANEMELHPHFQQPELFRYCLNHGIAPIGYSPIGSPKRPERDRTPDDTVDVEDPVILRIAGRLKVHPAVVCVKWAMQRGQTPIPFSVHMENYLSNIKGAVTDRLTDEDMRDLERIDRNSRLIKGQVFLWKDGQDWEDLWDIGGKITPA